MQLFLLFLLERCSSLVLLRLRYSINFTQKPPKVSAQAVTVKPIANTFSESEHVVIWFQLLFFHCASQRLADLIFRSLSSEKTSTHSRHLNNSVKLLRCLWAISHWLSEKAGASTGIFFWRFSLNLLSITLGYSLKSIDICLPNQMYFYLKINLV